MTAIAAFIGRRRLARKHAAEDRMWLDIARAAAIREGVSAR